MRVLTVAVHPDDETLGCGGTLLKHAAAGDSLHWLIVTSAHAPSYTDLQIRRQADQVAAVTKAYDFATVDWLKLPTTGLQMMSLAALVTALQPVIARIRPEIIYVPNRSDVHSDHRVVAAALQAVLKAFRQASLGVLKVLACEVLSETEAAPATQENAFLPTVFVDITTTIERKLDIMSLFETELQSAPLPREVSSIRALARHRGASVGVEYAEAFMLIRELR